jgi:lysozyme family protein
MRDFAEAVEVVLRFEGGYADSPSDPGGATNRGITQATYDQWRVSQGQAAQPVISCTEDEAKRIYEARYWQAHACDHLPWPLSLAHFDSAVQHGNANVLLQRGLGVSEDGVIGPETLAAALLGDAEKHAVRLIFTRLDYYRGLSPWPSFGAGWVKRMVQLYQACTA